MSDVWAPMQLSLAPKPLPNELLSSWLLRLAAANAVPLDELIDGLQASYPGSLDNLGLLDYSVPDITLHALSRFGRAPVAKLRALDLASRVPRLNGDCLLLQRTSSSWWRPPPRRVRFGFCAQCLAGQQIAHIRWDWCLTPIVSCVEHGDALLDRCPSCGAVDPVAFSVSFDSRFDVLCRGCGTDLAHNSERTTVDNDALRFLERAYTAALMESEPPPGFPGESSLASLQRFVDDMLQVLMRLLSGPFTWPGSRGLSPVVPRSSLVRIIAELVWNSLPSPDAITRWSPVPPQPSPTFAELRS